MEDSGKVFGGVWDSVNPERRIELRDVGIAIGGFRGTQDIAHTVERSSKQSSAILVSKVLHL